MNWDNLLGHEQQWKWFQTALKNRRLASSFLFVGRDGIGKRTFARLLAKSLLCRQSDPWELQHCGRCDDCAQVEASTHPDLIQLKKPADKAFLPIELLIGEREKRMRQGLCHEISLRPYTGRRKIAIIDDADSFNMEGANCLLKTLEEPPTDSLLILISHGLQRQLPTIRSRCQAILFRPLSVDHVAELLPAMLDADGDSDAAAFDSDHIRRLALYSQGSLSTAKMYADETLQAFHSELMRMLAGRQVPINELIKQLSGVVEAAGKDNRIKRDRLRLVFDMAATFYRELSLLLAASSPESQPTSLAPAIELAVKTALDVGADSTAAVQCWNRCLLAMEQVDRNANQAALIEAWTTDLAMMSGR